MKPTALALTRNTTLAKRRPLGPADVMAAFFARNSGPTNRAYRSDLLQLGKWLASEGHVDPDLCERDDWAGDLTRWLFGVGPSQLNALLLQWTIALKATHAPLTINRRLAAVRSLVKLGRTLGVINWALDVQGVRGASRTRDMRGPVQPDVVKLFAKSHGPYETALLHLLYTRGLRAIEARELKVQHLLLDRSEVLIRGKGKTGLAPVSISAGAVTALRELTKGRRSEYFVFSRRRVGNTMPAHSTFSRLLKQLAVDAEVTHAVRPHGLRHAAITAALDATNGDVRKVQKFSRHANPSTLLSYDDARKDFGGELTRELEKGVT